MPNFRIYIIMEIELCDTFYYRIPCEKFDIYTKFNTSKDNVFRNNQAIDFYAGEWTKIAQNNYVSHIVKPMETLDRIAEEYNTTIVKLQKDNELKTKRLFIGQTIKIYKQ